MNMEVRQGKGNHRELPDQATWIFSTFDSSVSELQMTLQLDDTGQGHPTISPISDTNGLPR